MNKGKSLIIMALSLCCIMIFSVLSFAAEEVFHGGDVLYTEPVAAVLFSHKIHVEDMGFDCDSCHDSLFEMSSLAAQEKPDFNMQGLYDGKYCGGCHTEGGAFAANTQCARCHIGVKGANRITGKDTSEDTHH